MNTNHCLNCNSPLTGKFCPACGQKSDTHRITPGHFISHDLIHGIWHLDKGIPFTIKEVFTRPGHAAMDYISGKRIRYYNVFYLMLLVLGFMLLAGHHNLGDAMSEELRNTTNPRTLLLMEGMRDNIKIILLCMIPLMAAGGYLVFRRMGLNYFEHVILAGFALLGIYILVLISILLDFISNPVTDTLTNIIICIALLFPIIVYFQATRQKYPATAFLWRMLLYYLILITEIVIVFLAVFLILEFFNTAKT